MFPKGGGGRKEEEEEEAAAISGREEEEEKEPLRRRDEENEGEQERREGGRPSLRPQESCHGQTMGRKGRGKRKNLGQERNGRWRREGEENRQHWRLPTPHSGDHGHARLLVWEARETRNLLGHHPSLSSLQSRPPRSAPSNQIPISSTRADSLSPTITTRGLPRNTHPLRIVAAARPSRRGSPSGRGPS